MQKNNIKMSGKRGFTLVELSVVLALVAIVTAMIVSFSVMMNNFSATAQAEYDFLEDSSMLKNHIIKEISTYDISENKISVDTKVIKVNGITTDLDLPTHDGLLLEFTAGDNNLIRCIISNNTGNSTSFIIALRSAEVVNE